MMDFHKTIKELPKTDSWHSDRFGYLDDEENWKKVESGNCWWNGCIIYKHKKFDNVYIHEFGNRAVLHAPQEIIEEELRREIEEQGITREEAELWLSEYRGCVHTELYEYAAKHAPPYDRERRKAELLDEFDRHRRRFSHTPFRCSDIDKKMLPELCRMLEEESKTIIKYEESKCKRFREKASQMNKEKLEKLNEVKEKVLAKARKKCRDTGVIYEEKYNSELGIITKSLEPIEVKLPIYKCMNCGALYMEDEQKFKRTDIGLYRGECTVCGYRTFSRESTDICPYCGAEEELETTPQMDFAIWNCKKCGGAGTIGA